MSCEVYKQLKLAGFSKTKSCVYESKCPFAKINPAEVEELDVAKQCAAANDEQSGKWIEDEDIEQDQALAQLQKEVEFKAETAQLKTDSQIKSLVSISRVN